MRAVSDSFKALITSSHQMVARARLVPAGQLGVNPGPFKADGTPLYELSIEDGDVQLDPSAEIRANAHVSVLADWPTSASDDLNIYGEMELFLERGVAYGDTVREWVSLGYFRLDRMAQRLAPGGPIDIEAPDRMAAIIDARLVQPRQYDEAATIRAVVEDLVQEVYPGLTVVIEGFNPDVAIGASQIVERERYNFLNEIAKSHACTMFFDYAGQFVMRPVPDPLTETPVWTINHGSQGVIVQISKVLDRAPVFNAVVADGEQATDEEPVQGIAYDENPNSPTRWGGPFGFVPRFFSSSFLRTNEQALAAAQAMLARSVGVPYTIDLGMVPNPALEPLDVVKVLYSDRFKPEVHVLGSMTIPMSAKGTMRCRSLIQPVEGS